MDAAVPVDRALHRGVETPPGHPAELMMGTLDHQVEQARLMRCQGIALIFPATRPVP